MTKNNWKGKLENSVQTREINGKIDEIILYKDGEVLAQIEEMDKGVLHVILYSGEGHHFSFNSNSEIRILKQS